MSVGRSREDYLEAILVLKDRIGYVRSVDVARHMKVSKASVCTMLSVLCEAGYVEKLPRAPYTLSLTAEGQRIAEQTYARHCFFRGLLLRAGVDEETADREACELEHAISPESFCLLRLSLEAQPE